MLYRNFGKTKEQVSILGFGCMRLPIIGSDPADIDEEKAIKMIRYAIDQGVNYIDTAYPYHGTGMAKAGKSEPFLAKALKEGYREKVKIATKLPSWLIKTREDMDRYLNEQLERLETDKIDFYLVHSLNAISWPRVEQLGVTQFLDQAIADGRIGYAGFSFHDRVALFKKIVDAYDWSFCQIQYNYVDETYQAGKEGLDYAASKGLGIAIMEPLRGGKLVNPLPEETLQAFQQADQQRTPAEWALRWLWNQPEIAVVLSGMTTMEQVIENIEVAKEGRANSLTEKEIAIVDTVKEVYKARTKVDCTNCGYCMPCPFGVNIPANFTRYNDYYKFGNPETIEKHKQLYHAWVKPEQQALNCKACGKCQPHCPQGIPISEELKKVHDFFQI
ncbi:aldo/keto reductase [Heliorestis convoluta]|uniref:Aldo/keto reductase n=1 Tax=Heliorestis convoluta TaxID=356322 RepID=A0A5Q2N9U4_9FIRM|nr:aldo/keto reductase [Heliorestis convoluta]QGG49040.1 aldo/keto reductase [Heliorestis convoluta]